MMFHQSFTDVVGSTYRYIPGRGGGVQESVTSVEMSRDVGAVDVVEQSYKLIISL